MESKKVKITSAIMALMLVMLTLLGCTGNAAQSTDATSSSETTTASTTTTTTTTTTTKKPTTTKKKPSSTKKKTTTTVMQEKITSKKYTTTQVYNPDRGAYLESIKGNKKLIAFTFDDGPAPAYTNRLLDNLDRFNARVTFFVVGDRVGKYAETLKRAHNMGNEIGSHAYDHSDLTKLSDAELMKQLEKTNKEVEKVIGVAPGLLRPPYGSYNDKVKAAAGVPVITWCVDTLDWKYKDKKKVCDNILKNAKDGAIVLMHDLYPSTVDGAIMAMDKLQHEGYAFVTVSELAYLKGKTLQPGKVYNSIK